jgi:amidase
MPTTAGSIALALNIPKSEATITKKLRAAGAIVLGKTNLSEFANWVDPRMPSGYSSLGGQVSNPYLFDNNPDTIDDPLGSSSGSGAGEAMAYAAVAIGTETSGSVISPSIVQSLVGVKPTLGLVSRFGIIPLSPSFDTAGTMARSVTDAAVLLGVIAGVDPLDAVTQRFTDSDLHGVVPDYVAGLSATALSGARLGVRSDDVASASELFAAALAALKARGAQIVELPDPASSTAGSSSDVSILEVGAIFNEFHLSLNQYLAEQAGPGLPAYDLTGIILFNNDHPDEMKYGQGYLIVSDATSGTAVDPVYLASREAAITGSRLWLDTMIDQNTLDAIVAPDFNSVSVTAAAGYPNLTVPMGYQGHAAHGLSFAGKAFTEARLLALAYDYEQATKLRRSPTKVNSDLRKYCPN